MNNETLLREFMQEVWNKKNIDSIPKYLADAYTIHLDHGDRWEGKILDHEEFAKRLNDSFDPFPDIHFEITTAVANGNAVGITWLMTGTNTGELHGFPPTNKKIKADGMTIYHFKEGQICGHTQVYDFNTIVMQLGFGR